MGTPQIPTVDSNSKQFPLQVRQKQAANFTDPATPEGAAVASTVAAAVANFSTGAISDAVTEWWCHPVATYLQTPYQRTVSGSISSTGKVIAAEFNHGTNRTRRYEVATAIVDDHSTPALWAAPGRRFLFAWTNHNKDNFVNLRVSNAAGDLGSFAAGPSATIDLGTIASYTQIHRIANLSDANQDTFWIVTRGNNTTWRIARVSVNQATGALSVGTVTTVLSSPNRQCYVTTADAYNASGNQVIRFSWGYNPAQPVHAIYYIEIDAVTGAITSPFDSSLTANVSGTGLPIVDTNLNPLIPEPAGDVSRRLFYTRPGPDAPAVAYAEGLVSDPDNWTYVLQEINPPKPNDPYGGLTPNTGYASAAYRSAMSQPAGFEYTSVLTTPTTAAQTEFGRSFTSGASAGFFLRLQSSGAPSFTTYTSGGTVSWTAQSTVPGFTWGMELGLRIRVNPGSGVAIVYYSLDKGQSWSTTDTFRATFSANTTMVAWTQPLAVPSTSTTLSVATNVRYAALKSLDGVVVAEINFRTAWSGTGSYTDAAGSVWTLSGGAAIAPGGGTTPATLGSKFTFGLAGPRVGYTAAANYIAGMAFETPSVNRAVYVARQDNGVEYVTRYRASGAGYDSGELLASGATEAGRYIRPYSPVNGGPVPTLYTQMTSYSDSSFTSYFGNYRTS